MYLSLCGRTKFVGLTPENILRDRGRTRGTMKKRMIILILTAAMTLSCCGCFYHPQEDYTDRDADEIYNITKPNNTELPELNDEQRLWHCQEAVEAMDQIIQTGADKAAAEEALSLGALLTAYGEPPTNAARLMAAAGEALLQCHALTWREGDFEKLEDAIDEMNESLVQLNEAEKIFMEGLSEYKVRLCAFVCDRTGQTDYDEGRITFAGDVGFSAAPGLPVSRDFERSFMFSVGDTTWAFKNRWACFCSDDITVVNSVAPFLYEEGPKEPDKRSVSWEYLSLFADNSVEMINLASRYNLDAGDQGKNETKQGIDLEEMMWLDDGHPQTVTLGGLAYVFLSFRVGKENDEELARICAQIAEHQAENSAVLVSFNWGTEMAATPSAFQQKLARAAVDAGADLIVGNGPRVIQGAERYKGTVIFYSLGELLNARNAQLATNATLVISAKFALQNGKAEFRGVSVIPCLQTVTPIFGEWNDYVPSPQFGWAGQDIIDELLRKSAGLKDGIKELESLRT